MKVSADQWDELCERLVAGDTQGLATLFQAGMCGPDALSPHGESLLSFAVELRTVDGLRFLLELGADPNQPTEAPPPLQVAASFGFVDKVELLLKAGADPNGQCGRTMETALHSAAQYNETKIFFALIKAGADPALLDDEGNSPIDVGAAFGSVDLLVQLQAQGFAVTEAQINEARQVAKERAARAPLTKKRAE